MCDDENYNGFGVHNNHRNLLSYFDDDVTMLRWEWDRVEVDEAKADEEEEGKEAEGGRKGKRKKRLSQKSFGDWAKE